MAYLSLCPSNPCLTRAFHVYCNVRLVRSDVLHFPFFPAEGLPVTGCHNAFCRIALIAAGNHVIAVKWRFCHVIFTIRYVSSSGFSDKLCVSISDISRFLFSSPWKEKTQEHFPPRSLRASLSIRLLSACRSGGRSWGVESRCPGSSL
jgi:hypothetical protein